MKAADAIKVLIVTQHTADVRLIKSTLREAQDGPFRILWAASLASAMHLLSTQPVDVSLVDLSLPDSQGIDTFHAIAKRAGALPVLLLCSQADEAMGIESVAQGAQGYLSKGHFRNALLPQALRSIIQRKQLEEILFTERERMRVTLESIGDGVLSTDVKCRITYLNEAAEVLTGWTREEAEGRPIAEVLYLIEGSSRQPARNPVELVIESGKKQTLDEHSILVRKDGYEIEVEDSTAPIFDRNGMITGSVMAFRDVSETQALSRKMSHMAQHDYLTGLPNRLLFADRLAQAIVYSERRGGQLAVLFLDLDNFKHINDSLGHSIGDKLLNSIAERLSSLVRHSDTVSRYGGDEFVLLTIEDTPAEHAQITAEKILRALADPHLVSGHELHITTSIGISVYPEDGADAETLIKNADNAMYHAKTNGRNNYQYFNSDMNRESIQRQSIETDLRKAVALNQFVVHYQPKVHLMSGAITGVEALLRWEHPTRGLLYPDSFINVAEESGLIVRIGQFVMRQACSDACTWADGELPALSVAVNVSAIEFRNKDFVNDLSGVLSETGLDPQLLQIELTESVLMRNVTASLAILNSLKALGVQLAIDDFGTGYSSLSYLSQFPIDILKIDKSFVLDIADRKEDGIIVGAVIGMGASLNHRVIAEGVETEEQLRFLDSHHCGEGQGYLFSRPISAEAMRQMMQKNGRNNFRKTAIRAS